MNGHVRKTCDGKCEQPYGCNLCNLFYCGVCQSFEGSVPSHCPGSPISEDDQQLIYQANLDFNGKRWFKRPLREWEQPCPDKQPLVEAAVARLNWNRDWKQLSKLLSESPDILERTA